MDLTRRLAQLDALLKAPRVAGAEVAPVSALQERALCERLGLSAAATPVGEVWTRDGILDDVPAPGGEDLPALAQVMAPMGAALEETVLVPETLLFVDTETTGLAGGTGTLVFLVGCAWWEAGVLRSRQYFLPGPGRETPLLAALGEQAARFAAVVTYNGARFDLPLLRTRALLARRPDPCAGLASWDLLRISRRLWGRRLPDCRQSTVEAQICGRARDPDDLPGALAPQAWLRWVRAGDGGALAQVLTHNQRDLTGMALILTRAVAGAARLTAAPTGPLEAWQDAWSAGRLCEGRRETAAAAAWIASALQALPNPALAPEAFFSDAVRLLKRAAAWPQALRVLELAACALGDRPWIHREAAILLEHRLMRLDQAWIHARRLGEPRRLARLDRKRAAEVGREHTI